MRPTVLHRNSFLHRKSLIRHGSVGRLVVAIGLTIGLGVLSAGCTPTVKVATDEPITINLNVNIKHEILVKVDKDLDSLFSEESDLF